MTISKDAGYLTSGQSARLLGVSKGTVLRVLLVLPAVSDGHLDIYTLVGRRTERAC
jgi:hypothetical protein